MFLLMTAATDHSDPALDGLTELRDLGKMMGQVVKGCLPLEGARLALPEILLLLLLSRFSSVRLCVTP